MSALAALVLGGVLAAGQAPSGFSDAELRRILKHSPLPPPPPDETNAVADDPAAALLGQALFFEQRLSGNGRVACSTCHAPERAFADGREVSEGLARGRRNTLALWNAAYPRWLFWDGRADTLWSQALKPIESPTEMGGGRRGVLRVLQGDPALRRAYEGVFGPLPDPAGADVGAVNRVFANAGKALAAYERLLVSRRAPFDVFVEGLREGDPARQAALSEPARRGLKLFVGRGNCPVCHAGPTFSDGEFHDLGVPSNERLELVDPGRQAGLPALLQDEFNAAGVYSDDRQGPRALALRHLAPLAELPGQVKTPSLRNVALTAPYMHQGQFEGLPAVLEFYSTLAGRRGIPATQERILVPLRLTPQERTDLAAFLESLTDDRLDERLRHPPALP